MDLPSWVIKLIQEYEAPETGRVLINIERYQGGVTKVEIGGIIRRKPPQTEDTKK
jgi:hypothetical protein